MRLTGCTQVGRSAGSFRWREEVGGGTSEGCGFSKGDIGKMDKDDEEGGCDLDDFRVLDRK